MAHVKPSGRMKELADIRASKGEILPPVKEQMLLAMDDGRKHYGLWPTDLSHPGTCHRLVSARMLGMVIPEEKFVFGRQNVFDEGDRIHKKWQDRMRLTGKLWGEWKCLICSKKSELGFEPDERFCRIAATAHIWEYKEIPFRWGPLLLRGHADGGLGSALIEIKSLGLGTLRFEAPRILAENSARHQGRDIPDLDGIWKAIRRPFPSHVRQANLYCWLAGKLGMPFDHIVFIYEAKWNQQVKEFNVQPARSIIQPMLEAAETISAAVLAGKLAACPSGSCKQCEGVDEGSPHVPGAADWPRQPDGSCEPDSAGYQPVFLGGPAGPPAAPDTGEPAGAAGPGADAPVLADQRMGQIPAPAAGNGRGRRIRRQPSDERRRSAGQGPLRGENSDGNESARSKRRVVRRGGTSPRGGLRLP